MACPAGRQFPAARLNQKWYGDGTEILTDEGKLYLASVMDAASRRILGFTLSRHHDAAAAYGALAMAITVRGGTVPGVIMHTDQGSESLHGLSCASPARCCSALPCSPSAAA
jgi:putative transposase